MRRVLALTVLILSLGTVPALPEPVDEFRALIDQGEFDTFLSVYGAYANQDDFAVIEASLVALAKDFVVQSRYETAQQILEVVLKVNLFNLEAQDVYVAVNSLLKNRVPGSDAPAVTRIQPDRAQEDSIDIASGEQTVPAATSGTGPSAAPPSSGAPPSSATLPSSGAQVSSSPSAQSPSSPAARTATPSSAAVPGPEPASPEATALARPPGVPVQPAAPVISNGEATPPDAGAVQTGTAVTEAPGGKEPAAEETAVASTDLVPTRLARTLPPMRYQAFAGPVSLLGNASGFYRDFYGTGRVNLAYGLSLDASLLFFLPRVTFGPELSFDSHFANLTAGRGDQIAYKITANVGFPEWLDLPLFFRLGFTQQWYLFGGEVPDVLITSFPSPTAGAKLAGLPLTGALQLDVSMDLYLISFFTSYLSLGFDVAASVAMTIPISEHLSLNPRIGLQPQVLVAYGNIEFLTKLDLGIGVVSHEP